MQPEYDHTNCPFYDRQTRLEEEFTTLCARFEEEIRADMNELGLKTAGLRTLIRTAAIDMARDYQTSRKAFTTPLTYTETSREGNEKPVSHPVHSQANTVSALVASKLKQLGIYAATDKVSTRIKDDDAKAPSGLEALVDALSKQNEE